MDNIGLDLHKRESQLCILTAEGEILEQRIRTSRERFTAVLALLHRRVVRVVEQQAVLIVEHTLRVLE